MKTRDLLGWSCLCLSATMLQAAETNDTELLKRQLREVTEKFEKSLLEQRQMIESLRKQIEAMEQQRAATPRTNQITPAVQPAAALALAQPAVSAPPESSMLTNQAWSPSQPLTLARAGSAYMNVSFGALVDAGWSTAHDVSKELNLGDHDPIGRGFSLRNAEIALDGAVDPYFKGFANIVFKLEKDQSTSLELEEAYLQTTSLPANLQLKAGQFFANFGRQNPQHPHQWAFVDQPLILTRAFGPDGLRNLGAQGSWLLPTPFYSEFSLGVLNGEGETAFNFRNQDGFGTNGLHGRPPLDRGLRGPADFLFVPRLAGSVDITDNQTILGGASAALGPNDSGATERTQIYGLDLYWKWKSPSAHAGFPFVSWQSEGLYSRFEAASSATPLLPAETLKDWGFYSQLLWGFKPRWVAGFRGEYVTGNAGAFDPFDVFRGERTRLSPGLTFYPTEFSKIRLQYNYDHGQLFGVEHSVWVQLELNLGAHGAHKF
jgi:hypothetical protein